MIDQDKLKDKTPQFISDAKSIASDILSSGGPEIQNEMLACIIATIINERCSWMKKVEKDYYEHKEAMLVLAGMKNIFNDISEL